MFLFILYKTHRVQSTLTIYTIYQGCYSRRKLTPPPSQQSTTASTFSVEEEAHQPLLHPFWNVYWLRLVQKTADVVSSWVHQYLQYRRHTLSPAPPPNPQVLRCEVGLVTRRMEVNVSSCSAFIRKANEYHFWTDGECFRWICHEPIASVSTDTGPTWVGPTNRQIWMGKGLWRSTFLLLIYWQLTDSGRRRDVRTQLCIDWWDHKTPVGSSKPRVID